jgi:hypothetical protein
MAWIEYHEQLRDHWKVQRLADIMGVEYTTALGCISCLWCWCVAYAKDGDVSKFNDAELQHAARTSNQMFTIDALHRCELMSDDGQLHDWHKHGLKFLVSAVLRTKKYRKRLRNRDVTVTPTLPNLTQPNLTIPKKTEGVADFMVFWNRYPKHIGKSTALKSWQKLNPDKPLLDQILNAIDLQKKTEGWLKEGGQFIPHPTTWLNQRRWEDEIGAIKKSNHTGMDRAFQSDHARNEMGDLPCVFRGMDKTKTL